jgi:hypothetical protein
MGTSAQFTLGQSFEISVGPPKVEIHAGYKGHVPTIIACGLVGAAATVFVLAYSIMMATYTPPSNWATPYNDTQSQTDLADEKKGDKERAELILAYQLVVDALLIAVMASESVLKNGFWAADDLQKSLFKADNSTFGTWQATLLIPETEGKGNWWTKWGDCTFGSVAALGMIVAEIVVLAIED